MPNIIGARAYGQGTAWTFDNTSCVRERKLLLGMRFILPIFLVVICSVAAYAQTSISVYTGTSYTRHSDLRIEQSSSNTDATFRDVNWDARPFAQAPYYGIRLSRFSNRWPHLGISFDYTHYKIYARIDQ